MAFETVQAAYACYKNAPTKTLEARAQAINADIAANPNADIAAYTIELEGLQAALEERSAKPAKVTVPEVAKTAGTEEREEAQASPEYRAAFYKVMTGRDLSGEERNAFNQVNAEKRAAFNNLSNSAAVVPTATMNEIIAKARKEGGLLSAVRQFTVPSNVVVPVVTPGTAAAWHTEGAAVEAEKVDPTPVKFEANEIMKILSMSASVQAMSISAFEAYLTEELTASVMATLAEGIVSGTGEGQATGILTGITWGEGNTVTIDGALTFADILQAMGTLKRGYANGAAFALNNKTLYTSVYSLEDNSKRPIYTTDLSEAGKGRIMGQPCIVDDNLPDDVILYGNPRLYGVNIPAGLALDMSRESSFDRGLVDFRAILIADGKPLVDEAWVKISKA